MVSIKIRLLDPTAGSLLKYWSYLVCNVVNMCWTKYWQLQVILNKHFIFMQIVSKACVSMSWWSRANSSTYIFPFLYLIPFIKKIFRLSILLPADEVNLITQPPRICIYVVILLLSIYLPNTYLYYLYCHYVLVLV